MSTITNAPTSWAFWDTDESAYGTVGVITEGAWRTYIPCCVPLFVDCPTSMVIGPERKPEYALGWEDRFTICGTPVNKDTGFDDEKWFVVCVYYDPRRLTPEEVQRLVTSYLALAEMRINEIAQRLGVEVPRVSA